MAMINSIILLIFFFLNILLSLFIYIKAGRRKDSLFFSLAIFATGLWALAIAISTIVNTSQAVLLWTRLAFFGPSLIIFLLVNFAIHFPKKSLDVKNIVPYTAAIASGIVFILSFTRFIVDNTELLSSGKIIYHYGSLYWIFVVYFVFAQPVVPYQPC